MKVQREELLKAVEAVMPGLSTREIIEQSSCVIFKDGKVHTYNDEIACTYDTDIAIQGAVQAMPLIYILRLYKEDEIEVELGKGQLIIRGKAKRTEINMESDILLPIDAIEPPAKWRALPEDFSEAIKLVQSCAGKDDSQFALTCIHVNPEWIEACDNQQVSRFTTVTKFKTPILIRRDSIKHIIELGMTEFSETENWVHFKNTSGLVLSCRRFVEEYPDLSGILKVKGEAVVLPKGIGDTIKKAEVFSTENVDDNVVDVRLSAGKLQIVGQGASGRHLEAKKVNYTGGEMSFGISPSLLVDIVQRHNECVLSTNRLKIESGKLTYVTVLKVEQ